jgi:NTE family protein
VRPAGRSIPNARESIFGASQILMQTVIAEKLKSRSPDVLVRPNVGVFGVLDFLKANAILKATAPVKDEVKRKLEAAIEHRQVPMVTAAP